MFSALPAEDISGKFDSTTIINLSSVALRSKIVLSRPGKSFDLAEKRARLPIVTVRIVTTIVTTINDGNELNGLPPYTRGQSMTDV